MAYFKNVVLNHEVDECLFWPYAKMGNGYAELRIDGRAQLLSREVCRRRHGEPPTPLHEAAHSCGNGHLGCVSPAHLRWATSAANKGDQIDHGTRARGERMGSARLTEGDVRAIRASSMEAITFAELGRRYSVSEATVRDAFYGRTWAWL
jgi:hypothetical protein